MTYLSGPLAPEMIRGLAYNQAVDWWALGALVYEMVTGNPPFRHKNKKSLHKKILTEKVSEFVSFTAV